MLSFFHNNEEKVAMSTRASVPTKFKARSIDNTRDTYNLDGRFYDSHYIGLIFI